VNEFQKELLKLAFGQTTQAQGLDDHPFEIGQAYIIRTVTMIQTGRLKAIYKNELVLDEASWVADTGRFSEFVEDMDKVNEMEPIKGEFIVGRGAIVDAIKVNKLVRKLK
jgi:hypothetical protein